MGKLKGQIWRRSGRDRLEWKSVKAGRGHAEFHVNDSIIQQRRRQRPLTIFPLWVPTI